MQINVPVFDPVQLSESVVEWNLFRWLSASPDGGITALAYPFRRIPDRFMSCRQRSQPESGQHLLAMSSASRLFANST